MTKTDKHVLAALRAIASERWHGKGCKKRNCGSTCLCAPCHARVALETLDGPRTEERLTMVEFRDEDFDLAEKVAKRLGYTQTAYTTTSALWGLFCLPDRASQKSGCVVKTKELGLMFVQNLEDMLMRDLDEDAQKNHELTRKRMAEREARRQKERTG